MLKTVIELPDGTELSSGGGLRNAVKSVTLTECVNSGAELTLGSTCSNALEATLITPQGGLAIAAGSEVKVYKEDPTGARKPVGIFILEKPTRPSANTMKLTGYDRVSKLDKDLTAWLSGLDGWPYQLTTFAGMVCEACGVPFDQNNTPNETFLVQRFTRSSVTGRQIMQWLGEICCSFCHATAEGIIQFDWYRDSGKTITATGDPYYFQNSLTYEDFSTAPIDAVQIRLADSEDGALCPEADAGANSYIITGNPILNATISDGLEDVLNAIKEELAGVSYTPCKVEIPANMDIRAGSTVKITDKNGKTVTAYVMTKTQTGQKDALECTGSPRRDSATAMNNRPASSTAESAAQNAFAGMTYEQLFKKLTDDGRIQGLFTRDNVWVLNAAMAVIENLIADVITAGKLCSKNGGVMIDLDKGVGTLARGQSAWFHGWDDTTGMFSKEINVVIKEFLSAELDKMQEDTIKDFAAKVGVASTTSHAPGVEVSLQKLRNPAGYLQASASFSWSDGTISHLTAREGYSGDGEPAWVWSDWEYFYANPDCKNRIFSQTDTSGNAHLATISEYPTRAGVYRVGPRITGLPHDTNGFGCLVIFNGGTYVMHLFIDEASTLYWARTVSADCQSISSAPTAWRKASSTEVSSGVV